MSKLTSLTPGQEQSLRAHRDHWFAIATSTEPADRPRAEEAARELAALGGVTINRVIWVNSPEAGARIYREQMRKSLSDSLRASLSDSLRASLWNSLWNSLWDSLRDSLSASLRDSLCDSLCASLSASLRDSLCASLWDSLCASLRASPLVAFYTFGEQLGVQYEPDAQCKLALTVQLLQSCCVCWIGLGFVVLCERPASVEVQDGKLVGLTWRQ